MFCSKCGAKLGKDDKFCKKCGQASSHNEKNDEPVPVAAKPSRSNCSSGCVISILVLLFIAFLGILFGKYDQIRATSELKIAFYLIGAFFVIIFGWSIFRPRKKLAQDDTAKRSDNDPSQKQPVSTLMNVVSAIITIVVVIAVAYYFYYFFKNIKINPENTDVQTSTATTNNGGSQKQTTSWDGYYETTMTKPNCDSPVELTAFSVLDEKVVNLYGNDSPIGSDNHATMTMNYSRGMTEKFTFFYSGGKKMLSGTWESGDCNGRFQGQSSYSY